MSKATTATAATAAASAAAPADTKAADSIAAATGKSYLLTGANGAIGRAIALGLATSDGGAHTVHVAVRNRAKGDALAADITKASGNARVVVEVFDQSDRAGVAAWAADFVKRVPRLHALVNNAAIVPATRQLTKAGLELQFATNVCGYVWLTDALHPALKAAAAHAATGNDARVVNVASNYAGELNLDDPQFAANGGSGYDANAAYRASKQANRMLSWHYADRYAPDGITVNACHPGVVTSPVLDGLGFGSGHESAAKGAATPLYLATSAAVKGKTKGYYVGSALRACAFAKDPAAIAKLAAYVAKL